MANGVQSLVRSPGGKLIVVAVIGMVWPASQLTAGFMGQYTSVKGTKVEHVASDAPPIDADGMQHATTSSKGNGCERFDGILHIREADPYAGAGTLFFVYVINQIIYAQLHNLLPWVHFNAEGVCYDSNVHNATKRTINVSAGIASVEAVFLRGKNRLCGNPKRPKAYPGNVTSRDNTSTALSIDGNGIWVTYFEPVVSFQWALCQHLPVVQIPSKLVSPGIHRCAPWAVRPWQVEGQPLYITPQELGVSTQEWLGSLRSRALAIVSTYFRPKPWLAREIDSANSGKGDCLAMHIRMTDKGHGRKKLPLDAFLPYAEAYTNRTTNRAKIYIATDDARILEQINTTWPAPVISRVVVRENTLRSRHSDAPVFEVFAANRHRTNTEALVEIYALSQCNYIVHGYSAVAESALYLNGRLHNHSVNLDDEGHMTLDEFKALVKNIP